MEVNICKNISQFWKKLAKWHNEREINLLVDEGVISICAQRMDYIVVWTTYDYVLEDETTKSKKKEWNLKMLYLKKLIVLYGLKY